MRTIFLAALTLLLGACSQQSDQETVPEVMTVSIAIPSAQCSMCDDTITEALLSSQGVQNVEVDMETKTVAVTFATDSVSVKELETTITKAGYDANDQKADPEAYEGLAGCCKLPETDAEETMDSM